ncbi:hypothetical protein LIER_18519 [Lithospermum erythrorhizon]|uniref:Uncharacterized protein n=1 Tax=Lithospermum erythrorhizon TaxID=34254 RepID=A0AAV3QIG3_LITER
MVLGFGDFSGLERFGATGFMGLSAPLCFGVAHGPCWSGLGSLRLYKLEMVAEFEASQTKQAVQAQSELHTLKKNLAEILALMGDIKYQTSANQAKDFGIDKGGKSGGVTDFVFTPKLD